MEQTREHGSVLAAAEKRLLVRIARALPWWISSDQLTVLALAGMAMLFCFFSLADLIAALVVIRISLQFLLQAVGVIVLRIRRPGLPRPFRMWLYPLPALLAITGFIFILTKRPDALKQIRYTVLIVIAGLAVYMFRAWRGRQWPFTSKLSPDLSEFPSGGTV